MKCSNFQMPCSKFTLKIAADLNHKGASFMEIRDVIIYILFMAMITVLTLGVYTQNSFHLNNAIANTFIHQPYFCNDERTDIFNVSSIEELWCYLNGRFMVTLRAHPFWGEMGTKTETFLLQKPCVRQVRVSQQECLVPVANRKCFGEFSDDTEDKASFGPANDTAWVYNPPATMGNILFKGIISYYNSAGYFFMLENASQLSFYQENDWIDKQTRAIFIDFIFYNINTNLFSICQILFELPPSGGVIPSYLFSTVKIMRYNDHYDHIVMACEFLFGVFCMYYSIEIFYEILYFKQRFWREHQIWIDILILALSWGSVGILIYRYIATLSFLESGKTESIQEISEYHRLKYIHLASDRVLAVTLFFSFLKLYRFLHIDTINQLMTTLHHCLKDMLGFFFLFMITLFAYAELGTLLFSNYVESYSTITFSIFTLLRIMMGEFHYQEVTTIHSVIGPVYIVSFVMFVVFLLLNMFLAIINATYSVVSSNVKVTRKSEYFPFLKHCLDIITKRFGQRHTEKVQDLTNNAKLAQFMVRSGFSELEIDTFLSRYTVDNEREIPDEVFQPIVHMNVVKDQLFDLKSRTNDVQALVQQIVEKKEYFLHKVKNLMRR